MNTSKIIKGVVGGGRYTVTAPIVKEDYGLVLKIEGIELPETYEVDFSNDEHSGTSVTMIGNADGVLIPSQFISSGKDIFAFLYHVGEDYGRTIFKFRIPNKLRPDRTNEQPTPEEQSVIDQAIGALNTAVAQTAQDKADADASAQNASADADRAEEARTDAQNYATQAEQARDDAQTYANNASTSATASAQSASQSAQIKSDVEGMVDDAQGYAQASERSASASANSASQAQGYAQSASASAQSASGYATQADISANTASNKASEASTSASTASQKATEAAQSATNASQSAQTAEQAKTASQTAQGLAESARDSAISAKTDAESAKDDAVQAKEDAESAVASISGALADKADVITDTASGAVASFSDGADDLPLKSLVVDINPIQDLHGQDAPYPAGGGKNKFNGTFLQGYWAYADGGWVNSRNWITTEKIHCKASTSYTVSADAKLTRWQGFVWYDSNGDFISTDNLQINVNIGLTKTSPSNAAYLIFNIAGYPGANDTIAPSDVTHFQLEEGSSSTAYAPYSNICPISGWTQVNVNHSDADTTNPTTITISLGQTVYGAKLYPLEGKAIVDAVIASVTDAERWLTWGVNNYVQGQTGFYFYRNGSPNIDFSGIADAILTNLLPINLLAWGGRVIGVYSDRKSTNPDSWYEVATFKNDSLGIVDSDTSEQAINKLKAFLAVTPMQIVYKLVNSITVQLSANQINSLLGVNNIWADSGDTEVEYRADTKLFIERLTAPDSADMIADANITSGQYFMVGNSLYKATANIANGGQIVVGTNCTRVSLAQALNEINA